jgi:hypothetical protein
MVSQKKQTWSAQFFPDLQEVRVQAIVMRGHRQIGRVDVRAGPFLSMETKYTDFTG